MRKSKFKKSEMEKAILDYTSGASPDEICARLGIKKATLYSWKKKYNTDKLSYSAKIKQLQKENKQLKQMFAEVSIHCKNLHEIVNKVYAEISNTPSPIYLAGRPGTK